MTGQVDEVSERESQTRSCTPWWSADSESKRRVSGAPLGQFPERNTDAMKEGTLQMLDVNMSVYEAEVAHRLEHVKAYLQDVRQGGSSSVMMPLWNLRALQDESRQAGHKDVAELCAWMERGIMELQMCRDAGTNRLITELISAGEHVRRRVHAAAHGFQTPPVEPAEPEMEARIA